MCLNIYSTEYVCKKRATTPQILKPQKKNVPTFYVECSIKPYKSCVDFTPFLLGIYIISLQIIFDLQNAILHIYIKCHNKFNHFIFDRMPFPHTGHFPFTNMVLEQYSKAREERKKRQRKGEREKKIAHTKPKICCLDNWRAEEKANEGKGRKKKLSSAFLN